MITDEQIEKFLDTLSDDFDNIKHAMLNRVRLRLKFLQIDPEKLAEDARDIEMEYETRRKNE